MSWNAKARHVSPASLSSFTVSYDSRWEDAPLCDEKVFADPHYRSWAREHFRDSAVFRLMLETIKARRGGDYRREDAIKGIAKLSGVGSNTVKNAVSRSRKDVPKTKQRRRRKKGTQHI